VDEKKGEVFEWIKRKAANRSTVSTVWSDKFHFLWNTVSSARLYNSAVYLEYLEWYHSILCSLWTVQ